MRLFSIIFSLFVVLSVHDAYANPQKRGRLADGRAFRIDANGYRLVDHVAELEVTIDELKRQVTALENELGDPRPSRAFSGRSAAPLRESNLVEAAVPEGSAECRRETAPLRLKIVSLENRLKDALLNTASAPPPSATQVIEQKCDYQAATRPLMEQIARLQSAMMDGPSKEELLQNERQLANAQARLSERESELSSRRRNEKNLAGELERLRAALLEQEQLLIRTRRESSGQFSKIGELEDRLEARNALVTALKSDLSAKNDELNEVRGELKITLADLEEKESQVRKAAQRKTSRIEKKPVSRPSVRTALRRPKVSVPVRPTLTNQMLARSKRDLRARLARIDKLSRERKKLHGRHKKKKSSVSISMQALRSKKGMSLEMLRSMVSGLGPASDVDMLQRGLSDIEAILRDDVRVLTRLMKS